MVMPDKYRETEEYHWVRLLLVGAARTRQTVVYTAIARIMGLSDDGNLMGKETGHMCGEISEDEQLANRPMLSAVAVKTNGHPGGGFFSLAQQLNRLAPDANEQEKREFWQQERDAVYEEWAGDRRESQ
jgi:hypothetical protein